MKSCKAYLFCACLTDLRRRWGSFADVDFLSVS